MTIKITRLLISTAFLFAVTACGQKGPLYIPNKSGLAAAANVEPAITPVTAVRKKYTEDEYI
ncbi:LPS translocon maturation chaperone LptM [Undibacterium sp. RuTC16W]|uniref:LPS translocon maturation chaperone LptM n=1 Tax=Undibacterium sp. RuTC16W TaxID=3413048 RepID=UPI003BF013A3